MSVIAHGVDLVEVARVAGMLDRHGERFLERCFTPAERAYAMGRPRRDEHLAARFAAKEAVLKALGTGWRSGIAWTDVGVVVEPSGAPGVILAGRARQIADEQGAARWLVSLSHAGGFAVASVIALDSA
ncbi:MAG: holo-[acyl-carrier-protein] synthase [Planctomycetota bacterium]|nr:MAG: holo-[acyl-carrier-protein] synthase [Planctomycetota bacterium]